MPAPCAPSASSAHCSALISHPHTHTPLPMLSVSLAHLTLNHYASPELTFDQVILPDPRRLSAPCRTHVQVELGPPRLYTFSGLPRRPSRANMAMWQILCFRQLVAAIPRESTICSLLVCCRSRCSRGGLPSLDRLGLYFHLGSRTALLPALGYCHLTRSWRV